MRNQRRLQRCQPDLVTAQRTIKRMLSQSRNNRLLADDQPCLHRPEQLVATKRNHINTTLYDLTYDWLINHLKIAQLT